MLAKGVLHYFAMLSLFRAVLSDKFAAADPVLLEDECASNDESCALNALQRRATKQVIVNEEGGESTMAKWYLGNPGESCTQVCQMQRQTCSVRDLASITNWQQAWQVASQAGAKCKMSWANDGHHEQGFFNGPLVCNAPRCGSDAAGTCTYDAHPRSTCQGPPAMGFSRVCPCSASAATYDPRPPSNPSFIPPAHVPAPTSLPNQHVPHPPGYPTKPTHSQSLPPNYPPNPTHSQSLPPNYAPNPAHSQSLPPHSGHKVCEVNTGGTCSILGCSKSRHAICDKKSKKCVCPPGQCSVNGACARP